MTSLEQLMTDYRDKIASRGGKTFHQLQRERFANSQNIALQDATDLMETFLAEPKNQKRFENEFRSSKPKLLSAFLKFELAKWDYRFLERPSAQYSDALNSLFNGNEPEERDIKYRYSKLVNASREARGYFPKDGSPGDRQLAEMFIKENKLSTPPNFNNIPFKS